MEYNFDILSIVNLTSNSIGQKLLPNEYIINLAIKQKILFVETRIFKETEPIPGDIITNSTGDYFYIEDFSKGQYKAIALTKDGRTRDNRNSPRLMSIEKSNRFNIVERGVPPEKFGIRYLQ